MSAATTRVAKERNWRVNELKVGDVVDVIKVAQVRDLQISAWSRGTVIFKGVFEDEEAKGDEIEAENVDPMTNVKIEIKYDCDREALTRRFGLDDSQVAPAGTYVDDFDWRYELKAGDFVDCMDDEKDWYKATILATRSSENADGQAIPEIHVGFRTFEEEGSKTDDDGRKFFGWSERYDAWYGVTDPQVQRFHSCHL